jgi:hypothetical protein
MNPEMDADVLFDSTRGLLIVVLKDGMVEQACGGFGGFLGMDVSSLPGTNVFDHVPPAEAEELALYFIENADESEETIALPLPFRLSILDQDGFAHPVDVIPTRQKTSQDGWSWTVLLVLVALYGSITRSLDLEMGGASRDVVRAMLCEELRVDNANYTSRWLLIDLGLESGLIDVSVSIGSALLDGADPLDAADHAMLSAEAAGCPRRSDRSLPCPSVSVLSGPCLPAMLLFVAT